MIETWFYDTGVVVSHAECDWIWNILDAAHFEANATPSTVYMPKEKTNKLSTRRKSMQMQVKNVQVLEWLESKIAERLSVLTATSFHFYNALPVDVIKYDVGDGFEKHCDFVPANEARPLYTLLICLKACEQGGHTIVFADESPEQHYPVGSRQGTCLLMFKKIPHAVSTVEKGVRWILKASFVQEKAKDHVENEVRRRFMTHDYSLPMAPAEEQMEDFGSEEDHFSIFD